MYYCITALINFLINIMFFMLVTKLHSEMLITDSVHSLDVIILEFYLNFLTSSSLKLLHPIAVLHN